MGKSKYEFIDAIDQTSFFSGEKVGIVFLKKNPTDPQLYYTPFKFYTPIALPIFATFDGGIEFREYELYENDDETHKLDIIQLFKALDVSEDTKNLNKTIFNILYKEEGYQDFHVMIIHQEKLKYYDDAAKESGIRTFEDQLLIAENKAKKSLTLMETLSHVFITKNKNFLETSKLTYKNIFQQNKEILDIQKETFFEEMVLFTGFISLLTKAKQYTLPSEVEERSYLTKDWLLWKKLETNEQVKREFNLFFNKFDFKYTLSHTDLKEKNKNYEKFLKNLKKNHFSKGFVTLRQGADQGRVFQIIQKEEEVKFICAENFTYTDITWLDWMYLTVNSCEVQVPGEDGLYEPFNVMQYSYKRLYK